MFSKILIANRGEIACRVARTARRLGIRTIAVFAGPDTGAVHTRLCDEAYEIGGANPTQAYLNVRAIVDIALKHGAEAIHPGYGFLSENAGFAEQVAASGLSFVGPSVGAIRQMGAKIAALEAVRRAGAPVLPSVTVTEVDEHLYAEVHSIGYPVMVKPSAGGGGKGMHVVANRSELGPLVEQARREARTAFGDDELLIEKYLPDTRHIEVQVFGDCHGNAVHLFERDCSTQRRQQKILEEAPAPGLDDALRAQLGASAVTIAKAIRYEGAGTVEFLFDGEDFYFLEMNTRLQVEHPVTEAVTGLDLVEWQLRVAAGEALPLSQDQLALNGHAIEARICAEDTQAGFLPSSGTIKHLELPAPDTFQRTDSGLTEGDVVSTYFDPLLLKIIARGSCREQALARLRHMLDATFVHGVKTNVAFLEQICAHPEYARGSTNTRFIEHHFNDLTAKPTIDVEVLAIVAGAISASRIPDLESPWHHRSGWRLNAPARQKLHLAGDDFEMDIQIVTVEEALWSICIEQRIFTVGATLAGCVLDALVDGRKLRAFVVIDRSDVFVKYGTREYTIKFSNADDHHPTSTTLSGDLKSPMPGTVIAVLVEEGQRVEQGEALMVIEAMKMEHTVTSPRAGVVRNVRFRPSDRVDDRSELLTIDDYSSSEPSR